MLTFHSEFEENLPASTVDVIIALDISNSMQGAALFEAKQVAMLLLAHLPDTCTFNLLTFGSTCEELFVVSKPKTAQSIEVAKNAIENCSATKGGTLLERLTAFTHNFEHNSAINAAFRCCCYRYYRALVPYFLLSDKDNRTNVIVISDGHFQHEVELLRQIKDNRQHVRVFTCGVR